MKQLHKGGIQASDQVADIIIKYPQLLKPFLNMDIRPALGNTTLQEACDGKSMDLELCIELLRLTIDSRYKPQSVSRYALLPLVDYYSKSLSNLRPWLRILGQHFQRMSESQKEEIGYVAVIKFYDSYAKRLERFISVQEQQLKETVTHLYELFYSPVLTEEDLKLLKSATDLTNKDGEIPSNELQDILSLLLRHTKAPENPVMYCGAMQQLGDLKSGIDSLNGIRAKLLYPMVNEMVRHIRKRKQETGA